MADLTSANQARLTAALAKQVRFEGKITSLRELIEKTQPMVTHISDGMMNYSRSRFNNMYQREQDAYLKRLKEKRLFFVNDIEVPKIVHAWASAQPGATQSETSLDA
jgi:pantothenate kinase-related protein Tda10